MVFHLLWRVISPKKEGNDMSFYFAQKPFEMFGKTLIQSVDLQFEKGEHIAVIGNNGVGKTTLLKALNNKYKEDTYLMDQNMTTFGNMTGIDYVISLNTELFHLKQALMDNYEKVSDYIALNGYEFEQTIITKAKQMALTEADLDKPIKVLSGGQQTRLALLRAFISNKPLILLDEPTNHLDQEMIDQLINHIQQSKRTIIYVSHHRGFIDQTASHVIEITPESTRKFNGNYKQYKEIKDLESQTEQRIYNKQQKEIQDLERTIKRVQTWHHSAQQKASVRNPIEQKKLSKLAQRVKVKEKQLNQKLQEKHIQEPSKETKSYYFSHQTSLPKRFLIRFEDVSVNIDGQAIYKHAHFEMKQNENILLTGPNGSGKSLFIALIRQHLSPDEGIIEITPSLKIGYFDQTNNNLNEAESPLSMLLVRTNITRSQAQTLLASFNFDKDQIKKPIRYLSMGEKSRLQFVLLYFSGANLLVLDEPTNYFDIVTQDLILSMIQSFTGQVLIVTHDSYLQSQFKAVHWEIKNQQLYNVSLTHTRESNLDETLKLLGEYKFIDENGHFETDN